MTYHNNKGYNVVVCRQLAFLQGMTQGLKFPMHPSISDSCTMKADEGREKIKKEKRTWEDSWT